MKLLENKNALITGGGRGIGKAVALDFASAGANVAVVARTKRELDQTVEEIEKFGVKGLAIQADLSNLEQLKKCTEIYFDHFDKYDILICNAGMTQAASIVEFPIEKAQNLFDLNIMGYYGMIKYIVPNMIEHSGGNIQMTSSVQGNVFFLPKKAAYSASKAAITAMGKCLSPELKPHNISINVILPGGVETRMTQYLREKGQIMPTVPPEEVSPIYLFLATEEAKQNGYGGKVIDQMKLFDFLSDVKDLSGDTQFNIKKVYKEMKDDMKKDHALMFRKNKELVEFLLTFKR